MNATSISLSKTNSNIIYVADKNSGINVIDVSNKSNPVIIGFFDTKNPY